VELLLQIAQQTTKDVKMVFAGLSDYVHTLWDVQPVHLLIVQTDSAPKIFQIVPDSQMLQLIYHSDALITKQ
jgi:hypothetical protein